MAETKRGARKLSKAQREVLERMRRGEVKAVIRERSRSRIVVEVSVDEGGKRVGPSMILSLKNGGYLTNGRNLSVVGYVWQLVVTDAGLAALEDKRP